MLKDLKKQQWQIEAVKNDFMFKAYIKYLYDWIYFHIKFTKPHFYTDKSINPIKFYKETKELYRWINTAKKANQIARLRTKQPPTYTTITY